MQWYQSLVWPVRSSISCLFFFDLTYRPKWRNLWVPSPLRLDPIKQLWCIRLGEGSQNIPLPFKSKQPLTTYLFKFSIPDNPHTYTFSFNLSKFSFTKLKKYLLKNYKKAIQYNSLYPAVTSIRLDDCQSFCPFVRPAKSHMDLKCTSVASEGCSPPRELERGPLRRAEFLE